MNIKILDSWLRDYVKTNATPQKIAEVMSLTSVGIERIEKFKNDYVYDIEVTTNRPDLMSVLGLAREASVALTQSGIQANFMEDEPALPKTKKASDFIAFTIETKLLRRLCAVVMDVSLADSPQSIKDRLESSDIRSLNNVIDITNYVMRLTGHPTHVFDYDRLVAKSKSITIREAKKGEKVTTLDGKTYTLRGGDIVADDGAGEIVDLLGVMGTANSVVTDTTKRILFFIDNLDPHAIRRTSMSLGIRTEAAILNEKDLDVSLTGKALAYGIHLFQQYASAKNISDSIDVTYEPSSNRTVKLEYKKLKSAIGVDIAAPTAQSILEKLGFEVKFDGTIFSVEVPSLRKDLAIPEDLIEEVARIYGYHNIPTELPPLPNNSIAYITDTFYWEQRVKEAMKHWGFTEVYTYSMVSKQTVLSSRTPSERSPAQNDNEAVTISNPLSEEWVYMRESLTPSLLQTLEENSAREEIKIFEISNVYHKRKNDLPHEELRFAGVMKKPNISFFEVKGLLEQLAADLGIQNLTFKSTDSGADVLVIPANAGIQEKKSAEYLGSITIIHQNTISFECLFQSILDHATLKKTYTPLPKYPSIIEDMTFVVPESVTVGDIVSTINDLSNLIKDISLIDKYENSRTFRITYQHAEKNLSSEDIAPIREKITKTLSTKLNTKVK